MLQIFDRRRVSDKSRKRDCVAESKSRKANPTYIYKNRKKIERMRVGNKGVNRSPWTLEQMEVLLRDLTQREVALVIFLEFNVIRSLPSIENISQRIKRFIVKRTGHRVMMELVKKHKLTLKTYRPFEARHIYGHNKAISNMRA